MPYIGTHPLTGQFKKLDAITVVNGQAAYTMQYNSSNYKPATANALLVSVNGVIQAAGDAYTISGSTITFTENLVTGDTIDFIIALGDTGSAVTPVDGSVTTAKLANDAVTSDKLAHDLTVQTSLSVPTIKDSSGTNTALSIDSTGRITKPSQPRFRAHGSGWFDLATNATWETITGFNTEDYDVGGCFKTSNAQFTVPLSGIYLVNLRAWMEGTVDSANYLRVYNQTDSVALIEGGENGNNNDDHTIQLTALLNLDANDVLVPQGYRSPIHATNDIYLAESYAEFSAILLA